MFFTYNPCCCIHRLTTGILACPCMANKTWMPSTCGRLPKLDICIRCPQFRPSVDRLKVLTDGAWYSGPHECLTATRILSKFLFCFCFSGSSLAQGNMRSKRKRVPGSPGWSLSMMLMFPPIRQTCSVHHNTYSYGHHIINALICWYAEVH